MMTKKEIRREMEETAYYSNIVDYFRAKVSGIEVTDDGDVIIRGLGTFNGSSAPLIIYDGVEIPSIKDLVPSEIHSVEVIKDGSKAIYGFRGANGVIIITSKAAHEAVRR